MRLIHAARTGNVAGTDDGHALGELVELEEAVRVDAVLRGVTFWVGEDVSAKRTHDPQHINRRSQPHNSYTYKINKTPRTSMPGMCGMMGLPPVAISTWSAVYSLSPTRTRRGPVNCATFLCVYAGGFGWVNGGLID